MSAEVDDLKEALVGRSPSPVNGFHHPPPSSNVLSIKTTSPNPPTLTSPSNSPQPRPFPALQPLEVASPTGSILPLTSIPTRHRPFLYLLCVCAFFVAFRPSEPYLTQYLMEDKGLGEAVVNEKVYPVWTYSYFAFLVPVGLAGEWLGYRALIGAEFALLLVTYVILIWGEGLQWMQVMQVTFGFTSAAQSCVFFTYIYQCCPLALYHTATGYQRASGLIGHVAGALVGQLLVSTGYPRWQLFLPTTTAIAIAGVAFFFLPTPAQQREGSPVNTIPPPLSHPRSTASLQSSFSPPSAPTFSCHRLLAMGFVPFASDLLSHLVSQYRHRTVLLFSLYIVLGNSVLELLLNYDLSLWYALDPTFNYNGIVLAVGWLMSAAAAFLTSNARVVTFVTVHPLLVLSGLPAVAALLVWSSTWTASVEVACVLFVGFYAVLSFLMVVSSALIASSMSFTAFAFLFSVNTFASLAVQSAVQLVIGEHGLELSIQGKYRVFGTQLLCLSGLYALLGMKRCLQQQIEREAREAH